MTTISAEARAALANMAATPEPIPTTEGEVQALRLAQAALDGPIVTPMAERLLRSSERREFDGVPVEVMIPRSLDAEGPAITMPSTCMVVDTGSAGRRICST